MRRLNTTINLAMLIILFLAIPEMEAEKSIQRCPLNKMVYIKKPNISITYLGLRDALYYDYSVFYHDVNAKAIYQGESGDPIYLNGYNYKIISITENLLKIEG
ncbi:hypothetical protein H8E88_16635 [candidate division KSB1 bacterium]|nr:hypothetical protein [candidate division KSB1 bacterium]